MIYFDNAATTLQKPPDVWRAAVQAMDTCGNPGRSGHKAAMRAAEIVYDCRCLAADFFGLKEPERVVFTMNATHALNIAIKSCLKDGGHAVVSGYEHNSVVRPLEGLKEKGVTYTAARSPLFDPDQAYNALAAALEEETRCVILTHVSNVFGFILPVEKVDALCQRRGIPLIIDASQSAGILPLDVSRLSAAAFVCMPGHKGLYGPQGTGILLCCKDVSLYSVLEGGTGSLSGETRQPDFLPDALESGTLNVPGIAGLAEGLRFVSRSREAIREREAALVRAAANGLSAIPGVTVWHDDACQSGVLSFRADWADPAGMGERLAQRGICLRSGLHCAPLAHQSAGTLPEGTLRAGFSAFNTGREVEIFLQTVENLRKSPETAKNTCFRY